MKFKIIKVLSEKSLIKKVTDDKIIYFSLYYIDIKMKRKRIIFVLFMELNIFIIKI
jgi:hypothetical protein